MAVIEEEPGVVIDCQSRSKTAVAEDAPSGYCSDGYETASDTELNNSVTDNDNATTDNRNNVCSVKSGDDEVSREVNQVESQENTEIIKAETNEKALVQANEAKLEGNSLFKAGQFEEALSKYEIAIQVVPDDPSSNEIRSICHGNRAACFSKLGKHEETIKECTKALELNPSYMKALLRRGEARENLEQYEESIADMTKILELDPSNDQARRSIIRLKPLADEKREKMKEEMMANNQVPNAIPVEQVALPPPPQQNLIRPIGVANPSRDLVAERCQEADRDRNATVNQRARYGPPPVHALTDDEFDRLHMTSPGIGLSLPGNLRLWQNASAVLDSSGFPAAYDSEVDEVLPSWATVDLPNLMYYAAITYCFNCRIEDVQGIRAGPFWAIYPDLIGGREISTLPGVLTSIVRDYHNDTN
ncbi:hypothetical protein CASFOL_032663 [Castilleja foliolosa]|uniref:Uncharacterized protein n=1 Tax=Castilleja foliolosa TaxID=1961234 RepID=A0ABD3C2S3_9LAMI